MHKPEEPEAANDGTTTSTTEGMNITDDSSHFNDGKARSGGEARVQADLGRKFQVCGHVWRTFYLGLPPFLPGPPGL